MPGIRERSFRPVHPAWTVDGCADLRHLPRWEARTVARATDPASCRSQIRRASSSPRAKRSVAYGERTGSLRTRSRTSPTHSTRRPGNQSTGAVRARRLGIAQDARVVEWHGHVQIWRKGLDILLDAWQLICDGRPDANLLLLLIGSGRNTAELRDRVNSDPRIRWIDRYIHDPRELWSVHLRRRCLHASVATRRIRGCACRGDGSGTPCGRRRRPGRGRSASGRRGGGRYHGAPG